MKKFFMIIFALVLAFAALSGCSESEEPETLPEVIWDYDLSEHWQNGENGEKLNLGAHETGNEPVCAVCGSRIKDLGSGNYSINGYDESGNIIFSKEFENGELFSEYECRIDSEGNSVPVASTLYLSDGIKQVSEYNENGDILKTFNYSKDGNIYFESNYEYAVSSEGFSYAVRLDETDYAQNIKYHYTYDEMSHCVFYEMCDENDMTLYSERTEYEYNEEGWVIYQKLYVNGLPSEELYFGIFDDGEGGRWTYYEKQVVYNEDGSYTVCEYDEYDELLSEKSFDSNGNEI